MPKYATWLTFSPDDEKYLVEIIENLGIQHLAPFFIPHITIYGLVHTKLSKIEEIIKKIDTSPFVVKKQSVLYSENFWKTVYIQIEKERSLDKIYSILKNNLGKYSDYEFDPHISLIYKRMEFSEKENIIRKLSLKSEFLVSDIAIQEFDDDILKWKIVKRFKLQ